MSKTTYKYYQPNKKDLKDKYGDCVIRALTKVMNKEWLEVFDEIHPISREMQVPFNCKPCYEEYLKQNGFEYTGISNKKGSKRPTVEGFALAHKKGTYYLNVANHCVAVVDGKYYDTWDSGTCCLYGYWTAKEKWKLEEQASGNCEMWVRGDCRIFKNSKCYEAQKLFEKDGQEYISILGRADTFEEAEKFTL